MIEIRDLTHRFGKQLLFENVNLSLYRSHRYGLIGANVQALRNWKKTRPNLYRVIMQGLAIDDIIAKSKANHDELCKIVKKFGKEN